MKFLPYGLAAGIIFWALWLATENLQGNSLQNERRVQGWPRIAALMYAGMLSFTSGGTALASDEKEIFWIDRFEAGLNAEGVPVGWRLERTRGPDSRIAVGQDQGKYSLQLLSIEDSFGIRKEISFDIRKYAYLFWKWKVTRLPQGGDIRKRETDDQAGQIYVLFPRFPAMINTRSVGYIWDSLAPIGLSGTSTAYSRMKYVVLQSGPSRLNQWISERRNVYEDYKTLFREEPPTVGGVLLYINSQHTKSSAECFYADIFFSSSLSVDSPQ